MLNTIKPIKVVCIYDAAIDQERITTETVLQYIRCRDFEIIRPYLISGEKPVIYNVQRLLRSVMYSKIQPITNDNERAIKCFQYGVESVENAMNDDGTTYDFVPEGVDGDHRIISREELEKRFDPCDVMEIGTMIWYLSFLRRNNVNGLAAPDTSLGIWARLVNQSVPVNQTAAHQNNSKQQSVVDSQGQNPTATMQENDVSKSVKPMDATVEVQG